MLKAVDLYYFSPTGGTKKAGVALAYGIAENVNEHDLAEKSLNMPSSDAVIVAVPVFAGRIPAFAADKLAKLNGIGKKAVTAVIYGVRAYDDALIELNDIMKSRGFVVIASAALIARHSMVPEVGAGRPDQTDLTEIKQFAKRVADALEAGITGSVSVPGNRPYRDGMKVTSAPISLPECICCGHCADICPTEAISVSGNKVTTDIGKCILCMSCTAKCPSHSRVPAPAHQAGLAERLGAFKGIRRENEFYISE